MKNIGPDYTREDVFILGNIASYALNRGLGEYVLPIIKLIQEVRPKNAAAFLLEAMHKYSIGEVREAIQFLEASGTFDAAVNRDEAVAFHLFLLQQDGQVQRAANLGRTSMATGSIESGAAREMIRIVTAECEVELAAASAPGDVSRNERRLR